VDVPHHISTVAARSGRPVFTSRGKAEHQATDLEGSSGRQERQDKLGLRTPR
jgi:hypothetical protein